MPSGQGHNYTGMLTRSIVFSTVLVVFLAATGMTIASIIVPNWLSYDSIVVCGQPISLAEHMWQSNWKTIGSKE